MNLPGVTEVEELFLKKAKEWADLVKKGNGEAFAQRMKALRDRFNEDSPDMGKAYQDMYKVVEGL